MKKRGRSRLNIDVFIMPGPMRAADEPTEYDVAAKTLEGNALTAWIRRWYMTRYVPEKVLEEMGIRYPE